jgi:hypothetical protein
MTALRRRHEDAGAHEGDDHDRRIMKTRSVFRTDP